MKRQRIFAGILALALLLALVAGVTLAQEPQGDLASQDAASTLLGTSLGTAFTYQGRLMDDSGTPLTGSYDFQFELYDAESGVSQVGSTVTVGDVDISDGLFTAQLDFGSSAFTGDARWLEIGVRAGSSSGVYTILDPRQPLTAVPYALSLRPGAVISDTTTGTYVGLNQRQDSMLTVDYGVLAETWGNLDHAVYGTAHGGYSIGVGGSSDHLDGYGGLFSNYSADGVAILAAGSGIIESTADSILYLSPHDMVVRGGSGVSVTPQDNGGVDIYYWSTGDKYLSIPVSTFGTLFGSPVYIKSIEVCYKTDATGYIDVTSVIKNNGGTGSVNFISNGTDQTSSTHDCYTITDLTPVVIDNSTWVQFNIHTTGTGHTYIYTVKLTLTEQQN